MVAHVDRRLKFGHSGFVMSHPIPPPNGVPAAGKAGMASLLAFGYPGSGALDAAR